MTVILDPENNETRTLFALADFEGKQVLEIGSGDGRLTWLYADRAAHVTAIEPFAASFSKAVDGLPSELEGRVDFQNIAFEDFAAASAAGVFDVAILSWSLC
jgi:16S rRNA A1518/A1519 N6-dimethyltransferase RsmA/KsgA/DIM1 with predicted DNA glycosylase/AP lyase activity